MNESAAVSQAAYILRIAPGGQDKVPEALQSSELIIGWARAAGLLDSTISWEHFREVVRMSYYSDQPDLRKAGAAAGHLWRFIREMKSDDLIVVPYGGEFFVAKVAGPPTYDLTRVLDDSAYRRAAQWLNSGKPISRQIARSALVSRMKIQGTCANATDLLEEINECLSLAEEGQTPRFQADLQARLIREVLAELRSGRIESFGFERLIQAVLCSLGAEDCRIIPRNQDKGADILARFRVAGAFQQVVAVQAKHWQPDPPVSSDVVEQLIRGIEAEAANLGMVVTSGTISEAAVQAAEKYFEQKGIKIELLDGELFAKLMIEYGIRTS